MAPSLDPLESLNARQREAVSAGDGPVLVLAGPGSGKTRVLTHRVAYLVQTAGVAPWRVMAVTFTNKAAREMARRIEALIGHGGQADLTVGTFHAICARILRREAAALGMDSRFVIYDASDQERLVKRVLEALRLDEKKYRPRSILTAISSAKNELIRPADWQSKTYWDEIAGRVYSEYQALLRASNALDFDDLLLETAYLLRDRPEPRERYRRRYAHILVDEFQDTNAAQYALLKALAAAELADAPHNLFVVGDEDQSIYRWRGADYRNVMRFRQDFPGACVVLLEQNYRSTQNILDAARSVIRHNLHRTDKALWTEAGRGATLSVFEAHDENEEAAYVVHEIERSVAKGQSYGHHAVMYRTNAQSRALEDALVRIRVPYQLVGATRFYERREVKDILAYLRLAHNPLDTVALERVINVPPRGIGAGTWGTLQTWAVAEGWSLWTTLQALASGRLETGKLPARARNALIAFHYLLAELLAAAEMVPVPELVTSVLEASGYDAWLRDGSEEGEERWENVQELRGVAEDFAGLAPGEGLAAMLEAVALVSDVDDLTELPDRVTLLTLHAAKGLEFDTVFIVGLEEGSLPHMRALDEPEGLDEERRLFYVGLTRARRKLFLTHAFRRTLFGSSDIREPSRFLDDLPLEVTDAPASRRTSATRRVAGASRYQWAPGSAGRPPMQSAALTDANLVPGDRVVHGRFGAGVVVAAADLGDDRQLTVAFEGAGVKKLVESLARLQKRS